MIAAPVLLTLAACSSDSNYDFAASRAERDSQIAAANAPQAILNLDAQTPANSILPFPNSLFLATSNDGTLDLPVDGDPADLGNPVVAMNQLNGFSTVAPISTTISEPLAPETLIVGDTIRLFEVTTMPNQALVVSSIDAEISDPRRLVARSLGNQLVLIPTVPLNPGSDYLVALTRGVQDIDGNGLVSSFTYTLLKGDQPLENPTLELLRQATASQLAAIGATAGIDASDIALSWVFRTQTTRDVLQAASDQAAASSLALTATGQTSPAGGKADLYIGTLDVPYYLTAPTDPSEIPAALNSFWRNAAGNVVGSRADAAAAPDSAPVLTSTQTIPVLMSVPNAASAGSGDMPASGWPVTIFQHGITGNRSFMLGVADALADAGRAVIAIDLPLHGIIDTSDPLHASNTPFSETERTFGIDLATNPAADGSPVADTGPDGQIDPSGQYFINLRNLANTRDNLRQAVADLFTLRASLGAAVVEGVQLDASDLSLIGHSLGGIVGGTVLAFDSSYHSATLAMPGGGISQLLANSPRFAPVIEAGLRQSGIEAGTDDYESFLLAAQTLVDSGDPINHAISVAAAGNTPIHLIEVLGDQVIPNSVTTAPLSGTEPLARLLGLTQISENAAGGGLVKFSAGDHGSIIRTSASPEATVEMQRQTATFAASRGTSLPITDGSVIALPE